MTSYGFKPDTKPDGTTQKRWEKLLQQPGHTGVWDMSTGEKYRVEQFVPVYSDKYQSEANYFKLKGTDQMVYVPFLRLLTDGVRCSLMKKP